MAFARAVLLALLVAGCRGQPPAPAPDVDPAVAAALKALAAKDLRVATVAYRLQTGAIGFCSRKSRLSGLVMQDASQYQASLRPAVAQIFHLGSAPAVVSVVPGGAAEKAGVRAGDEILAVNGNSLSAGLRDRLGPAADSDRFTVMSGRFDAALAAGPVNLSLRRDGKPLTLSMEGAPACASNVQLDLSNARNASTDGTTVTVFQGLYDFVQSDDELAVIIGHELAHNILGHRERLKLGDEHQAAFLDTRRSRQERIRATERQADDLGLYLVAWAGYDVHAGAAFWRRMEASDRSAAVDETHPGDSDRVHDLDREAAAIDAKRTADRLLVPDDVVPGRSR